MIRIPVQPEPVHGQAGESDARIRDCEPGGLGPERVGDADGSHEHEAGHCEHRDASGSVLEIDRVAGPRELRPCPPDEPEEECSVSPSRGRVVVVQGPGKLGDGEHEDEVEEELEVGGLLRLRRRRQGCGGHASPCPTSKGASQGASSPRVVRRRVSAASLSSAFAAGAAGIPESK